MRTLTIFIAPIMLMACATPTKIKAPDMSFLTITPAEKVAIEQTQERKFRDYCAKKTQKRCIDKETCVYERVEPTDKQKYLATQCETFDEDKARPCPALERLSKGGKPSYFTIEELTERCERQGNGN